MRTLVLIGLCFYLLLMGVLGFAPIELNINDKLLHFSLFCILSIFLYFIWNLSLKKNLILGTTSFLTCAIGSEFIQGLLPYRSFDIKDILANITGGTLGLSISCLVDYCYCRKESKGDYQRVTGEEEIMIDTFIN